MSSERNLTHEGNQNENQKETNTMKSFAVELKAREFNKMLTNGTVVPVVAKGGHIYAEVSGRGPTPIWMKDLAKMRGIKDTNPVRLRERIGLIEPRVRRTKEEMLAIRKTEKKTAQPKVAKRSVGRPRKSEAAQSAAA